MTRRLDRAHEAAARLTAESSADDLLDVLRLFREVWFPDGVVPARGTVAWMMNELLPRWIEANGGKG